MLDAMAQWYYISRGDEMKTSPLSRSVQVHKAMAHPARLRILAMLRSGELCVCQITAVLGLAPSTVSAHLKELRNAGLTAERKEGKWVYIGPASDGETGSLIQRVLGQLEGDPTVLADARLVAELRAIPVETLCRTGFEPLRDRTPAETEGRTEA
jgi:DNA-binding transcriptional ArsR family regulator